MIWLTGSQLIMPSQHHAKMKVQMHKQTYSNLHHKECDKILEDCAKRMKIKIVVNMIVVGLVMLAGSIYVTMC